MSEIEISNNNIDELERFFVKLMRTNHKCMTMEVGILSTKWCEQEPCRCRALSKLVETNLEENIKDQDEKFARQYRNFRDSKTCMHFMDDTDSEPETLFEIHTCNTEKETEELRDYFVAKGHTCTSLIEWDFQLSLRWCGDHGSCLQTS